MIISIIIVNYNSGDLIEKCISSILKTKDENFEIIVVDNASVDGSNLKCKKKFPMVKFIQNKKNLGFSEGNNVGIRNAKGDFIVFLNPDTEVEPSWLKQFVKAYDKLGESILQPKILYIENRNIINTAGGSVNIFGIAWMRALGTKDVGQYDHDEQIGYASGACLFISRKTLEKIGFFDPYLFAYHDDLDISWKAAHLQIKSYYIPSSVVYHLGGSPSFKNLSQKKFYLLQRNRWYCLLTHYSRGTFYKILPSLVIIDMVSFLFYLLKDPKIAKIFLIVFKDLIKDRKLINKKYNELESRKSLSDKEILFNFLEMPKYRIPINRNKILYFDFMMKVLAKLSKILL